MLGPAPALLNPTPPTPQVLKLLYRVAPLSICRNERGKACLIWQVAGESGVLILPYPKWFKKHTWQYTVPATYGPKGEVRRKAVRYNRTFWDYVEAVLLDLVGKTLREKNYSPFKLVIS